jgi:hypothetical protein
MNSDDSKNNFSVPFNAFGKSRTLTTRQHCLSGSLAASIRNIVKSEGKYNA